MASAFRVINAPKQTAVATPADLFGAIHQASPGEVLTLAAAGAPVSISFDGLVKPGYGVTVVLPTAQVVQVRVENGCEGLHFIGGEFSADTVIGTLNSANNGLQILSGSRKISVHGSYFGRNSNAIQAQNSEDIVVRQCRLNASRQDQTNFVTCFRVAIISNNFEAGIKGDKICYYQSGSTPQHNISSGTCTGGGGIWEDTAHNDVVQARNQCTDFIIQNNYVATFEAQGFVSFGAAEQDNWIYRVLVSGNTIVDGHEFHGIWLKGTDIDIRNNNITPADPTGFARITVAKIDVNSRVVGGNNVASGFINPAGVDLSLPTINGDSVTPPTAPQIIFPAWRPSIPVIPPSPVPVPTYAAGGGIRPTTANPAIGTWLSVNRGQWLGNQFVTWEYEWRRGSTIIGTQQVYQLQNDDGGQELTVAVRGTNTVGTGEWFTFPGVTPAMPPPVATGVGSAAIGTTFIVG